MSRLDSDFLGATCMRWEHVCDGILESDQEDCYCHIAALCHHCEQMTLKCPKCGWTQADEED